MESLTTTHLYQERHPTHKPKFPKISMVTTSGSQCRSRKFQDFFHETQKKARIKYSEQHPTIPRRRIHYPYPDLYQNPDKFFTFFAEFQAYPVNFFGDGRIMLGCDNRWGQWFNTQSPDLHDETPTRPNCIMERYLIQLMVYATNSPEVCMLNSKVGQVELRFKIGKKMINKGFEAKVRIYPLHSTEEKNEIVFAYCRSMAQQFLTHWEQFLNPKSAEFVKNFFMFHTKLLPIGNKRRIEPFTTDQHAKNQTPEREPS